MISVKEIQFCSQHADVKKYFIVFNMTQLRCKRYFVQQKEYFCLEYVLFFPFLVLNPCSLKIYCHLTVQMIQYVGLVPIARKYKSQNSFNPTTCHSTPMFSIKITKYHPILKSSFIKFQSCGRRIPSPTSFPITWNFLRYCAYGIFCFRLAVPQHDITISR